MCRDGCVEPGVAKVLGGVGDCELSVKATSSTSCTVFILHNHFTILLYDDLYSYKQRLQNTITIIIK